MKNVGILLIKILRKPHTSFSRFTTDDDLRLFRRVRILLRDVAAPRNPDMQ